MPCPASFWAARLSRFGGYGQPQSGSPGIRTIRSQRTTGSSTLQSLRDFGPCDELVPDA